MTLVNLTPHAISFIAEDGSVVRTIDPSGTLARVSTHTVTIGEVDGLPVTATEFGEVEGLPEPQEGTAYIVSSLVAQRVTDRVDVFIPNESVRDDNGRIIGCRSLGLLSLPYELYSATSGDLGRYRTVEAAREAAKADFIGYPDEAELYRIYVGKENIESFYLTEEGSDEELSARIHFC